MTLPWDTFAPRGLGSCAIQNANEGAAAAAYSWMLFSQSAWVFGQAMELSLSSLDAKIWADGLQYFAMCASAIFGVVFAHRFAGLPLPTGPLTACAAVTGLGCVFYATAPLHHLAREGVLRAAFADSSAG